MKTILTIIQSVIIVTSIALPTYLAYQSYRESNNQILSPSNTQLNSTEESSSSIDETDLEENDYTEELTTDSIQEDDNESIN